MTTVKIDLIWRGAWSRRTHLTALPKGHKMQYFEYLEILAPSPDPPVLLGTPDTGKKQEQRPRRG